MLLLASVSSAADALAARAGGADVIDAKDPGAGALGAVRIDVFEAIRQAAGGVAPLSAALGDAPGDRAIEGLAFAFAAAGAAFVKIGVADANGPRHAAERLALAVRGVMRAAAQIGGPEGPPLREIPSAALGGPEGPPLRGIPSAALGGPEGPPLRTTRAGDISGSVVAAGFADAAEGLAPLLVLIDIAAAAGARGVLLDTIDKRGPGVRALVSARALAAWVRRAHEARLLAAVAGKIEPGDIAWVRDAGADIVGVRGAACDGGRTGRIVPEKVRLLRQLVHDGAVATVPRQRRPARLHRTPACRPTS